MAMATASTGAAAMAASADENRVVAFEAIEASGESQYRVEHRDHQAQQDEAAARAGEQQPYAARQSSLLALTLEEIQNTMCEPGKNFGSMNMDEFVSNIWTAEEGTAMASGAANGGGVVADHNGHCGDAGGGPDAASNPASLCRQGSVSLPANLCRKTVDEVWSEIQRDQQQRQHRQQHHPPQGQVQAVQPQQYQSSGAAPCQITFGEMTLEDFLIKAGVVPEGGGYNGTSSPRSLYPLPLPTSPPPETEHPVVHHPLSAHTLTQQQQQSQYGMPGTYTILNERPGYGQIPMTMGYGDHQDAGPTANGVYHNYHHHQPQQGGVGNGYGGGGVGYRGGESGGGWMGNGHIGVGSPVSPVSSDGFGGHSQVDNGNSNPGGPWGTDMGAGSMAGVGGGRKRILDGPVDKVMERRQRRMIKNRESAARSRARKQAYTVELETELNLLKEENARLQEEQRRLVARRRQMLLDVMAERAHANSQKNAKAVRHSSSCVW